MYHYWQTSNFEFTYKKPPFIKVAIFPDVILVLNYYCCKEEAINLLPHYLIDIIHKLVKPSHLENLQIIQNINKLMFQIIFTFSYRILIKQHSFNAFSRNVNIINWKSFPTHDGIGIFSPFPFLVILLLVLPSNFIVSRLKSLSWYPV